VIICSITNCGGAADSDCTVRYCDPISSPAENQPREGLYEVIKKEAQKAIRAKKAVFSFALFALIASTLRNPYRLNCSFHPGASILRA
jgi:hypothetical protein